MSRNLHKPISDMKRDGEWPIPWTSAAGLVPEIEKLGPNITGCEIGISFGFNLIYFLDNLPNISKVHAIDPFSPYDDGPVGFITEEMIDKVKQCFLTNIEEYKTKVNFINLTSDEATTEIEDDSLDYIFIDGNHNYEFVKKDINNYYDKVKTGGIFAGHDYGWGEGLPVQRAVSEFFSERDIDHNRLRFCANDTWFIIK
jgi:hypothetical protein